MPGWKCIAVAALIVKRKSISDILKSNCGYESQKRSDGDTEKKLGMKEFQYGKTYSCAAYKCYLQDFYTMCEIKQVAVKFKVAYILQQ